MVIVHAVMAVQRRLGTPDDSDATHTRSAPTLPSSRANLTFMTVPKHKNKKHPTFSLLIQPPPHTPAGAALLAGCS